MDRNNSQDLSRLAQQMEPLLAAQLSDTAQLSWQEAVAPAQAWRLVNSTAEASPLTPAMQARVEQLQKQLLAALEQRLAEQLYQALGLSSTLAVSQLAPVTLDQVLADLKRTLAQYPPRQLTEVQRAEALKHFLAQSPQSPLAQE